MDRLDSLSDRLESDALLLADESLEPLDDDGSLEDESELDVPDETDFETDDSDESDDDVELSLDD